MCMSLCENLNKQAASVAKQKMKALKVCQTEGLLPDSEPAGRHFASMFDFSPQNQTNYCCASPCLFHIDQN